MKVLQNTACIFRNACLLHELLFGDDPPQCLLGTMAQRDPRYLQHIWPVEYHCDPIKVKVLQIPMIHGTENRIMLNSLQLDGCIATATCKLSMVFLFYPLCIQIITTRLMLLSAKLFFFFLDKKKSFGFWYFVVALCELHALVLFNMFYMHCCFFSW